MFGKTLLNGASAAVVFVALGMFGADAHADAVRDASVNASASALTGVAQADTATAESASAWKTTLVSSADLSQGYYSNWVAGGSDNVTWVGNLDGSAKLNPKSYSWENNLKLAYGQSEVEGVDWIRKVADAIHADSTYTRKLNGWVNPYLGATFDSQFQPGYDYSATTPQTRQEVSAFMDPGYLVESLGLGTGAGDWFHLRVGAAAQETFTQQFTSYAEGGEHPDGDRTRIEYGGTLSTGLKLSLAQNLLFTSDFTAFSNLEAYDQVQWKLNSMIAAKVNSWLSVHLAADSMFDKTQSTLTQFMETLSVNFSYNLL